MEPPDIQFVGPPCGHHGSYTFYRAFKFTKGQKTKVLSLGQFFFAKITPDAPVCIGDLQLVWHHKNHDGQPLCSVRLYFLPEDTPDGRLACHGEDEILSASEKVVLKIEDLVSWMCDVLWTKGLQAICEKDVKGPSQDHAELAKMFAANNCGLCESSKDIDQDTMLQDCDNKQQCDVLILSFPQYCRYRGVRKRLEACIDMWMRNIVISAVGGFTVSNPDTHILFCRDTVEHPSLLEHASRQNHLAPNLKGRPRKRKLNFKKSGNFDSDTNDSEEGYDPDKPEDEADRKVPKTFLSSSTDHQPSIKNSNHAGKKRKCKFALRPSHKEHLEPEEDTFLKNLYQFMQERNTPISRLPTLGFKELDLYFFYNYTHKLGGYEAITQKRMWKHIYDTLGGHPSNTSAATCTRRHYERLLLPFERHIRGEEDKPLPVPYVKPRKPLPVGTGEAMVKKEAVVENTESTEKTKPEKTKPKVTCHLKLTEKEKQWEAVRRKSHLNKDKVLSVRKTVKRELQLQEQAATKQPTKSTSEEIKTSAQTAASIAAQSRVNEQPPVRDSSPMSLIMQPVTEPSSAVTQKEVIQGAVTAPPLVAMMQQKSGEIGTPKMFPLPSGPVMSFVSQPSVVYVRTKPVDTDTTNMGTCPRVVVKTTPSVGCGRHTTLPSNGCDAAMTSSRPSVIHRTLTPPAPPGDGGRNKSVLNPAPIAIYGPPSHIVPGNHPNSTFANGIHTTNSSVDSNHLCLPLPQLGSEVRRELPPRYVIPRPQFIQEPLGMASLQPARLPYNPVLPVDSDDQPKDLSMKTLRKLQKDGPQQPVRTLEPLPPAAVMVEDGPINLVVTRPRLHSPVARTQPSGQWGGVSSGGVMWNARLQTAACDAPGYQTSVTGNTHLTETQRGIQSQSSQQTSLDTSPYVHPAFPHPPGTALSPAPVPLFYKGPHQQPPPARAYGNTPTLLTAVPYGGPVIPDLAMYSRPRGPYMVPVGIPLVNQTAAHSKGKAKY